MCKLAVVRAGAQVAILRRDNCAGTAAVIWYAPYVGRDNTSGAGRLNAIRSK
jgi:hypothetical protein